MTNFDVITRKHVFFKNQNIIDVTVKIIGENFKVLEFCVDS